MIKSLLILIFTIASAYAQNTTVTTKLPSQSKQSNLSNFSLQYYVNFAGPKLSNPTRANTYSKWKSGKDSNNNDYDPTDSVNAYNSVSLRYKINNNMNLSYSYVFQNFFNTRSEYKYTQKNFSKCVQHETNPSWCKQDANGNFVYPNKTYTGYRDASQDYYDQSLTLFYGGIVDNRVIRISSGLSYVHPTTESSKAKDMLYSFIIAPDFSIKNSNYSISHGFLLNAQRYYYKNNEGLQTFTLSASPYFNYMLTNNLKLTSMLTFDWDQSGKNEHGTKFDNNMDNIFNVGLGTSLLKRTYSNFYIEGSIEEVKAENMFIGFNTTVTF